MWVDVLHQGEHPQGDHEQGWVRVRNVLASFDEVGARCSPGQGEQGDNGRDDDLFGEVAGAEADEGLLHGLSAFLIFAVFRFENSTTQCEYIWDKNSHARKQRELTLQSIRYLGVGMV